MTLITPSFAEFLPGWLARQRWYAGRTSGADPVLRRLGGLELPTAEVVGVDVHLVADTSGPEPVVYQVPLTYRSAPLEGAEHALVAQVEHRTLGPHWVYDAPHDPAFAQALLDIVLGERSVTSRGPKGTGEAVGCRAPGSPGQLTVARARVLDAEQSNTSVVITAEGEGPQLIAKVFRVLQDGHNPDIELQGALADAGSALVARPYGSLRGSWPLRAAGSGQATGDLAFVQEFLPGVQDAWSVALASARVDDDFSGPARALGATTGAMHADLARALGSADLDEGGRAEHLARLTQRLDQAVALEAGLAAHAGDIRARHEALAGLDAAAWPAAQRIHGDYHLGQVLHVPGRGWVVVDFEGEPLRPLAQRSEPDLPLRDVAGMLRSFDYAAGSVELDGRERRAWAERSREAFLAGYREVAGDAALEPAELLDALELDKAAYEVVYEQSHRPAWAAIPVAAITRLVAPTPAPAEDPEMTTPQTTPPEPAPAAAAGQATAVPVHELVPAERADHVRSGRDRSPHDFLGAHETEHGVVVRALRPLARSVTALLPGGVRVPLEHGHAGVFAGVLPTSQIVDYRLEVLYEGQPPVVQDDPYRHLPTVGEIDLHLIGEGRHEQLWAVLGSHVRRFDGPLGEVEGTAFAVWAPNAEGVRVVGDVNHWDGVAHPMRSLGGAGVWELFVPGAAAGSAYKYEIATRDGRFIAKADPLARRTECPPRTASVVEESTHAWGDDAWMTRRAASDPHTGPMSVYEVHLGSWRQGLSYTELAEQLSEYVVEQGFTHVELLPVAEHPYGPSWGYQVSGYYAPTARFGTPDEFRYLIDRLHQAGVGVIIDWVPAHFPKDEFALARFDGEPLYEHPDPRRGDHPDWGTHIFDYGRPQVRNFLVANATYWLEEFHIDGLRVDAVASMLYLDYSRPEGEWLPNQYGGRENLEAIQLLQEVNAVCYRRSPGIVTIAEDSTAWPGVTAPTHEGGLGFGLKWNMGWMHDTLDYLANPAVHRQYHHTQMTFSLMYAFSEAYMLPISHDEVVHGKGSLLRKMPGDRWQQLATVRAFLAYQWTHPGKQLLFMGCEFAQDNEWADGRSLDWELLGDHAHAGVQQLVRDLNQVYAAEPALWQLDADPAGFRWIDANDAGGNTFSYVRYPDASSPEGRDASPVVAIVNFSGAPRHEVRIGMPSGGAWREVINTDSTQYGGSGVGNLGQVLADGEPWHGLPHSVTLTLPPLGALILTPITPAIPEAPTG